MNAVNVALDTLLVWHFGLGARGAGLGTAAAEWTALMLGLALALGPGGARPLTLFSRAGLRVLVARDRLVRLFAVNRDLMIRTVALLVLFTWFANAGARLGAITLAANHVLMQFIELAAYVLDAFAMTAEERVGTRSAPNRGHHSIAPSACRENSPWAAGPCSRCCSLSAVDGALPRSRPIRACAKPLWRSCPWRPSPR
jgi:MATE family multidrug resistance protein